MSIKADYLGMALSIDDLDGDNVAYFKHCSEHQFHLQKCDDCKLLRYPPTSGCPFCSSPQATWTKVEGKGEVHSYEEVHHAIQPAFKGHTPYMVLLVDLDTHGVASVAVTLHHFIVPDGSSGGMVERG